MIRIAIGVLIGYAIGRYIVAPAQRVGLPQGPARPAEYVPLYRIADDLLYMTDQLRPALVQLRSAARDGSITPTEGLALYSHFQRLTD